MSQLNTPYRIVRVSRDPDGAEIARKVWCHCTTKEIADSICDGLNLVGTAERYYAVEPVEQVVTRQGTASGNSKEPI